MGDERRWRAVMVGTGDRVRVAGHWRTVKGARTDRFLTGGLAVILDFERGRPVRMPATSLLDVVPRGDWVVVEETAGGPPTYELECTLCGEFCQPTNAPSERGPWALDHTGRTGHDIFRAITTSFLRVVPTPPGGAFNDASA
ncbi:hypothetical protein [Streptomyces scopuliridis]|uniref:Uncharacterized protein n=1 Tax=Streptomyces scopuliridis TaxID=452529 RepID=A0ACD4ZVU7_9ACTN|nr:hypothetical protein [Streptomyces scopuliridis]WSC01947.1 hypothetical protein OG835_36380 [Streptomyces scopuliridis]